MSSFVVIATSTYVRSAPTSIYFLEVSWPLVRAGVELRRVVTGNSGAMHVRTQAVLIDYKPL